MPKLSPCNYSLRIVLRCPRDLTMSEHVHINESMKQSTSSEHLFVPSSGGL